MIRDVHPRSQIPDPDLDVLPIPDPGSRIPGVKKASDPGSQIRIRNTALKLPSAKLPVPHIETVF
jgi:hypothetical protein